MIHFLTDSILDRDYVEVAGHLQLLELWKPVYREELRMKLTEIAWQRWRKKMTAQAKPNE
jgi:hypothetical protein